MVKSGNDDFGDWILQLLTFQSSVNYLRDQSHQFNSSRYCQWSWLVTALFWDRCGEKRISHRVNANTPSLIWRFMYFSLMVLYEPQIYSRKLQLQLISFTLFPAITRNWTIITKGRRFWVILRQEQDSVAFLMRKASSSEGNRLLWQRCGTVVSSAESFRLHFYLIGIKPAFSYTFFWGLICTQNYTPVTEHCLTITVSSPTTFPFRKKLCPHLSSSSSGSSPFYSALLHHCS